MAINCKLVLLGAFSILELVFLSQVLEYKYIYIHTYIHIYICIYPHICDTHTYIYIDRFFQYHHLPFSLAFSGFLGPGHATVLADSFSEAKDLQELIS